MFNIIDKETGQYSNNVICNEPTSYTSFVKNNYIHKTDSSLILIGLNHGNNRCIKKYEFKFKENILVSKDILCDSVYVFAYLADVYYDNNRLILCGQANKVDDINQNGESVLIVLSDSGGVRVLKYGNRMLYNSSVSSIEKRGDEYLITTLYQLPNKKGNIKLFSLDSNFFKKDSFTFSPSLKLDPGDRSILVDSNILVIACNKGITNDSVYPYYFSNPAIVYFNIATKSIVKIQDFGDYDLNSWDGPFENLILGNDGNVIYGGSNTYYVEEKEQRNSDVVIGKLDLQGNPIWRKFYTILDPVINDATFYHWLYDLKATSDGNYICYGEVWGYTEEAGRVVNEAWIFKIDEEGNFVNTGGPSAVAWENEESLPVTFYPNPATDYLFINQGEIENLTYEVNDELGRVIFKIKSPYSDRSYMLDVSSLVTGNYFLKIMENGNVKGSLKFQKL
ncbi:MAG: T9SS type A sorting domain-containing protein [Saprospiraceae bacterium]|nr:T9SS type A sorting domain-containing protein [Saprospiraceae bacterium]